MLSGSCPPLQYLHLAAMLFWKHVVSNSVKCLFLLSSSFYSKFLVNMYCTIVINNVKSALWSSVSLFSANYFTCVTYRAFIHRQCWLWTAWFGPGNKYSSTSLSSHSSNLYMRLNAGLIFQAICFGTLCYSLWYTSLGFTSKLVGFLRKYCLAFCFTSLYWIFY